MKSVRVLGLVGMSSVAVAIGAGFFLRTLWPHVYRTLQNTVQAVSYACQVAWVDITREQILFAVFGAMVFALFFIWVGYNAYRAMRLSKKVHVQEVPMPMRVLSVATDAGLAAGHLTITQSDRAFAMTIGLRWPAVVISTAALRVLTYAQLQAVLEHEAHHVAQREPLRRLGLTIALLWVPFRKLRTRLRELYIAASEVEADEQVRHQDALGNALLQLVAPAAPAVGFSPLAARVERLLNPDFHQSGIFAVRFAVITLVLIASAVVLAPKSIAAVFGNHPSPAAAVHLDICRVEHERMLQSRDQSCGKFSTPQTCATK